MKISILTLKFEPRWILARQISGKSTVIDDALSAIRDNIKTALFVVVHKEFHLCRLVIAADTLLEEDKITEILKSRISDINDDAKLCISLEESEKNEISDILTPVAEKLSDSEKEFLKNELKIDFIKSTCCDNSSELAINKDSLIGIEPLKKWIDEIALMSGKFKKLAIDSKVIQNCAFLFSINRGNGLSTVLNLMAKTLKEASMAEFKGKRDIIEWKLTYQDNPNEFQSFEGLLKTIGNAADANGFFGIVCINLEDWLDNLDDKRLDALFKFVWNNREEIIFVFTIPYVEDSVAKKVCNRIDDIISTKYMKFVPPSDSEYFSYFCNLFKKYEIEVADDVFSAFVTKITAEKNDGKFYGFNTVKKISNEILYQTILNSAKDDSDIPEKITRELFFALYGMDEDSDLSGMEQLNDMIALNEVKTKVHEILSVVKLQKEMFTSGSSAVKPCFHMMFSGNPGTGKTVVARIVGKIFKEEGLLPIGNFFEVTRKDFIGKFVGHTAPKTMEICRNAIGSVLFIDEAYMLADERDSYSSEAIGTLIAEMENNRDKMVVIFAGYEKELEGLFDMNPGLRDRIPHKVHFANYNRDELEQIFFLQLKNKLDFDETFKAATEKFFKNFPEEIMKMRDFSNGRFIRNLSERIISKAALRFEMSGMEFSDFKLTESDFNVAIADADFQKLFAKEKHTKSIGF